MISGLRMTAAALLVLGGTPAIAAGTATEAADMSAQADALGACLVAKSTGEDRITVARWMLAAMASAPTMADVVKVDPARKAVLDQNMAKIFTRLLAVDCANQARPLFKAQSQTGFEAAGGALGKIAVKELLTDPKAAAALSAYVKYLDEADFAKVLK